MRHFAIPLPMKPDAGATRDSLGGYPFLPAEIAWPLCPQSKKRMVLFFQFDVRPEFGLALEPGSHVLAFMSPDINEIDTFERLPSGEEPTERFWAQRLQHFKVFVFGPDTQLSAQADADPYLVHQRLDFTATTELSEPFLAVGGEPQWYQDAEEYPGFEFICQLSDSYPFPQRSNAPEQPDSFSAKSYCLFLGNSTHLFARANPRDPEEVVIVLQN